MENEYPGLEDDCILPSQFFDTLRARYRRGELRLMLAVLEDAIACVEARRSRPQATTHGRRFKGAAEEALEWLRDETDDGIFSFGGICGALGLEPKALRRGILAKLESGARMVVKCGNRTRADGQKRANRMNHRAWR